MAFMKLFVYNGPYYLIETMACTTLVPDDDIPADWKPADFRDYVDAMSSEDPDDWTITEHDGWYGRYSAPGYLDCTDWAWADTEEELIAELKEMFDDDDDDDDDDDETDADVTYGVVVGNIGTVYAGPDISKAIRTFDEYVGDSKNVIGCRAYGEDVALFVNYASGAEIEREHYGHLQQDDELDAEPEDLDDGDSHVPFGREICDASEDGVAYDGLPSQVTAFLESLNLTIDVLDTHYNQDRQYMPSVRDHQRTIRDSAKNDVGCIHPDPDWMSGKVQLNLNRSVVPKSTPADRDAID